MYYCACSFINLYRKVAFRILPAYYVPMCVEQQHSQKGAQAEKISLEDVCPVLYVATKTALNAAEVGLFFTSPLLGPEITIPAIVATSVTKAMAEDLPRLDILTTQLLEREYAKAFDGSLHYSRRIADSCLRQKAPQAVVNTARTIAGIGHNWTRSLLNSSAH